MIHIYKANKNTIEERAIRKFLQWYGELKISEIGSLSINKLIEAYQNKDNKVL